MSDKFTTHTKIVEIEVGKLRIHPIAQRALIEAKVKKMLANFDPDAIGVLAGVEYEIDGELAIWIIDGQHRVAVLMRHPWEDMKMWPVKVEVHEDIKTNKESCALFVRLQERTPVRAFDKFKAARNSGDEHALAVTAICEKYGYAIHEQQGEGRICCVSRLVSCHKQNPETLDTTIRVIKGAWANNKYATDGNIVGGIFYLLFRNAEQIDIDALIHKVGNYPGGPVNLLADGKNEMKHGANMQKCIAQRVLDAYNIKRRGGKGKVEQL